VKGVVDHPQMMKRQRFVEEEIEQQQFVARKPSYVGSVWILHSGRDQYSR
jgi:hypothetical protein